MPPVLLIHKQLSLKETLAQHEAGGRKRGRTAGSWVDEIASQKKVITLCPECTPKFNPAKVGYRKEKDFPVCHAKCDGCSLSDNRCSMYIYDELYRSVRCTKDDKRAWLRSREQRIKQGYL